jgi:hypothetical protein
MYLPTRKKKGTAAGVGNGVGGVAITALAVPRFMI